MQKDYARFLLTEKYLGKKSPAYFLDLLKLYLGYPLAYTIGYQPFLGLTIDLRYKPLIPRPETEFWLKEYVIKKYHKNAQAPEKVLDIFSGSGCMGLAFAKAFPESSVVLFDKSRKAIKQIELNARINNVQNIKIARSDIFGNINDKFNLILANPPYVPLVNLSFSVLLYEPLEATLAKNKGLSVITHFLLQAGKHLNNGAEIFMEFEENQADKILKIAKEQNTWSDIEVLKDQYGKDRVLYLKYNQTKS